MKKYLGAKKIMLKTNIIKYTNNKVTYHAYFQDILGIMFRYVKKNLNKKNQTAIITVPGKIAY